MLKCATLVELEECCRMSNLVFSTIYMQTRLRYSKNEHSKLPTRTLQNRPSLTTPRFTRDTRSRNLRVNQLKVWTPEATEFEYPPEGNHDDMAATQELESSRPLLGDLTIIIKSANDLLNMDWKGESDPFCRVLSAASRF